jgi:hypothetical protein
MNKLIIVFQVIIAALLRSHFVSSQDIVKGSYIDGDWDLKWEDSGDSTIFTFSTKLADENAWSAFALSKDKQMVIYQ